MGSDCASILASKTPQEKDQKTIESDREPKTATVGSEQAAAYYEHDEKQCPDGDGKNSERGRKNEIQKTHFQKRGKMKGKVRGKTRKKG